MTIERRMTNQRAVGDAGSRALHDAERPKRERSYVSNVWRYYHAQREAGGRYDLSPEARRVLGEDAETLRATILDGMGDRDRQDMILFYLADGSMTTEQIVAATEIGWKTARTDLRELSMAGKVERELIGPGEWLWTLL